MKLVGGTKRSRKPMDPYVKTILLRKFRKRKSASQQPSKPVSNQPKRKSVPKPIIRKTHEDKVYIPPERPISEAVPTPTVHFDDEDQENLFSIQENLEMEEIEAPEILDMPEYGMAQIRARELFTFEPFPIRC